jgi:tetratricopeptide (TPR) repeat protein
MSSKLKEQLDELDRQIEAMQAAGNRAGEAAARAQKALLYALSMDLQAAAKEIAKAGVLAEEEGQVDTLARVHLARGKALLNQPGQHKAARDALHEAASLYHTLEDPSREAEVLKELANLDIAAGDSQGAMEHINRAIGVLEDGEASEPEQTTELYQMRSSCHLLLGDLDSALTDLDAALDLAQQSEDSALALQIRVQQYTLQSLRSEGTTSERLAALLQEAQRAGNLQVVGDIQLQQAAQSLLAGQYHQALEQAQTARQAARESDDLTRFVRYLSASLLMAEAQEQLEDRPGVLATLLTCKVYLETHLGPEVGRYMNMLLDTLEQRWGREGLAEAVRIYQQRAQEQGPYQA